MNQTIFPFKLAEAKRRKAGMTAFGGLPLILEAYRSLGLDQVVEEYLQLKSRGWTENAVIEEMLALQVAGGECMDDVDSLRSDDVGELIGYRDGMPSSATVRRLLHLFDEGMSEQRELGEAYVPEENEQLKGLNELYRQMLKRLIKREKPRHITLDVDASVVSSEKEQALPTYKGGTGYQPIQAIWAEKGIIVADQFRDGNVPASFGALDFLKKCESNLPRGIKLRIRSDGAWYQHELMRYCMEKGYEFSISADISPWLMRFVYSLPRSRWVPLFKITDQGVERTAKEFAVLSFSTASARRSEIKRRVHEYRYIVIRERTNQTDLFKGEYEYEAICTNMKWCIDRQVMWHYERAGTIEHVIRNLKHDLAGGKLPCGTFGANAAWWRITCIAHNLIQALKVLALPFCWFYYRLKRLRFKLFCIAGRIIRHARQTILQLPRGSPIIPIYNDARHKLAAFA